MFTPDNDDGRAMLTVLMRFGLSAESARMVAPWLEPNELTRLQRAARRLRWEQIGARIKLTEQERTAHKLWQFRPHDVPGSRSRSTTGNAASRRSASANVRSDASNRSASK